MAIDFISLGEEVREAARQAFTRVREGRTDEQFYAFALYSDDDAMTVIPSANSLEGLQRQAQRYGHAQVPPWLRWGTAEWAYEAEGADCFNEVCDRLGGEGRYDEDESGAFETFRRNIFDTMILALADLDKEGFFGTGEAREQVTLFCTISDSDDAPWLENESARRLNPAAVYEAFRKNADGEGGAEGAG